MKLHGVMIGSENPDALGKFYTKSLGNPGWENDHWYGYDVSGGNLLIGPHSAVRGKNESPARIIVSFDSENVKQDFSKIRDTGATVIAEPYQPSKEQNPDLWLATLAGPDGNYLHLSTPWES